MNNRRTFLKQAGLVAATLPMLPGALAATPAATPLDGPDKWRNLRALFPLDPEVAHFANFLVTAHPARCRQPSTATAPTSTATPPR